VQRGKAGPPPAAKDDNAKKSKRKTVAPKDRKHKKTAAKIQQTAKLKVSF
jgi:hypothetical protein